MKFDVTKPGIVLYLNITGLSREKAEKLIIEYEENFKIEGVNFFIIPTEKDTRLETFYNPK